VVKIDDDDENSEENIIRIIESSDLQLGRGGRIHRSVKIIINIRI